MLGVSYLPLPRFGERLPKVPHQLNRLFQALPKTDLHTHLSGSVRKQDIRVFMRENGMPAEQIEAELKYIKPHYSSLTDYLNTYYLIPVHVKTPSQFRRATLGLIKAAAAENVRILEIRSSILGKGGKPEEIVSAIEDGLKEGEAWVKKHKGFEMKTGLIILAQRYKSSEESLAHAQLAVDMAARKGSKIIGFDLAGDETFHDIAKHEAAIRLIKTTGKALGLKLTLHAGEVPISEGSSGLDSLKKAIAYGADRIGHGLQAHQDEATRQHLINSQLPLEICPWSNVQTQAVNGYANHPMTSFLADGMNLNLNTDSRLVCQISLTKQLRQLWQHKILTSWDQLQTLMLNGVRASFISDIEKKQIEKQVRQELTKLSQRFAQTIQRYLPAKPLSTDTPLSA